MPLRRFDAMAKCIKCGGSFLTRRKVKLKDALICGNCYRDLGFTNYLVSESYSFDDIKDGYDAYWKKKRKEEIKEQLKASGFSVKIAGVNDYPEVNPTDGEQKIFDYIKALCPVELTRKASEYVTAVYNETDVARFKFTERAKWVLFPYLENNKKRYIEKIEDLSAFKDDIIKSYDIAVKTEEYNK